MLQQLGFKFKPSKMQPPSPRQKIQGVILTHHDGRLEIASDPARLERLLKAINDILKRNEMSPDQAAKLAGKLQFTQEAIKGNSLRACIQPFYTHATAGNYNSKHTHNYNQPPVTR